MFQYYCMFFCIAFPFFFISSRSSACIEYNWQTAYVNTPTKQSQPFNETKTTNFVYPQRCFHRPDVFRNRSGSFSICFCSVSSHKCCLQGNVPSTSLKNMNELKEMRNSKSTNGKNKCRGKWNNIYERGWFYAFKVILFFSFFRSSDLFHLIGWYNTCWHRPSEEKS